ncbi:hypothetical protein ACHAW6_010879 [Cyclotella cf. meneghiniana]
MPSSVGDIDPASEVARFWTNLRSALHNELMESTRWVLLAKCPAVGTFLFDLIDDVTSGDQGEAPILAVEAGTPRPVVSAWNDDKLVHLVVVERDSICGAAVGNDVKPAARDFKACSFPHVGEEGVRCPSGSHVGPRVKRMNSPVGSFLLAIPVPSGPAVKNIFSRPVLETSDLYHLQQGSPEFQRLLSYQMEARVWKILFELFPGAACLDPNATVQIPTSMASPPKSAVKREPVSSSPISSPPGPLGTMGQSFQVEDASLSQRDEWSTSTDGDLQSVRSHLLGSQRESGFAFQRSSSAQVADETTSDPQAISPPVRFPFQRPATQIMSPALSHASSPALSRTNSAAGSWQQDSPRVGDNWVEQMRAFELRIQDLELTLESLQIVNKDRDVALGEEFEALTTESTRLQHELSKAKEKIRSISKTVRCHPYDTNISQALDEHQLQSIVAQVARSLNLSAYATKAELDSTTRLQEPSPALMQRLEQCEGEVFNNAGSVPRLLARVEALEAAKVATAVELGGHIFTDEAATDAWARTFMDPNLNRFCTDFVSLFLLAEPKFEMVASGLEQMAAVVKANFASLDLATIGLSYSITYPPRILKMSDKPEAQLNDGIVWAPPFASFEVFEGDYNNGTYLRMKKALNTLATVLENGIDFHFPIGTRPKPNNVFKAQTRLLLTQCIEFLDSLAPLYRDFVGSGLSAKDSWQRVAAYARQIFAHVATIRTPNSEASVGSLIWASFRTSQLLKEYQANNWIEHPKTSSILARTAMRKEGHAITELSARVTTQGTTVNRHTGDIKKVADELKELKRKNPTLL